MKTIALFSVRIDIFAGQTELSIFPVIQPTASEH